MGNQFKDLHTIIRDLDSKVLVIYEEVKIMLSTHKTFVTNEAYLCKLPSFTFSLNLDCYALKRI